MQRALRITGWLPALLVACITHAHAQSPAHEQWIRTSTQKAMSLFLSQGIPALQASVQTCYQGADRQGNVDAFILEAERCTAEDHLGLILFTAEKKRIEKSGKTFNHAFFNQAAHDARLKKFWQKRGMGEIEQKRLVDRIFAITYNEFLKPSTGLPAPQTTPSPEQK